MTSRFRSGMNVLSIGLACVVVLALVAGNDAKHRLKHQSRDSPPRTCLYENATYPGGSRFRPDPCTICHCPKRGGRPDCVIEDCKYDPDCVKYVKTPESLCCDVCVEHGCRDNDGHVYRPGQIVSTVSCTTCRCPEGGGQIECTRVKCPETTCVDPVRKAGSCCKTCPNGDNCWLGKEILPAGKVVKINDCKTCRCPDSRLPRWLLSKSRHAICSITNC